MEFVGLTFGLSIAEVREITAATLILFAVAFSFRELYRFIIGTNYGRF